MNELYAIFPYLTFATMITDLPTNHTNPAGPQRTKILFVKIDVALSRAYRILQIRKSWPYIGNDIHKYAAHQKWVICKKKAQQVDIIAAISKCQIIAVYEVYCSCTGYFRAGQKNKRNKKKTSVKGVRGKIVRSTFCMRQFANQPVWQNYTDSVLASKGIKYNFNQAYRLL